MKLLILVCVLSLALAIPELTGVPREPKCTFNSRPSGACMREVKPLCGTDFLTYENECELCRRLRETQNKRLAILHDGECTAEEKELENDPKLAPMIKKMRSIPIP